MSRSRLDAVYVCPWSLQDPLCESQTLPYLRGLAANGIRFALITFEQRRFETSRAERRRRGAALAKLGIEWFPLPYRPAAIGGLSRVLDIIAASVVAARLAITRGARVIHGRSTVPAAAALLAATTTGRLFFYDADGPLAQEYVDVGTWRNGGLLHTTATRVEERCFRAADACAVLSEARRLEIAGLCRVPVQVLPCAVDTARFRIEGGARDEVRRHLGLSGMVAAYLGKAGGRYSERDMFAFLEALHRRCNDLHLLVISRDPPGRFTDLAAAAAIPCTVVAARSDEVPTLLAAADVGLSFLSPLPCNAAASPIKNGEYLSAGLAIVTSTLAGDYPTWVRRHRVGVVVEGSTVSAFESAAESLCQLMSEPDISARARATAYAHVDLQSVVIPHYEQMYAQLLGRPLAPR